MHEFGLSLEGRPGRSCVHGGVEEGAKRIGTRVANDKGPDEKHNEPGGNCYRMSETTSSGVKARS